MAFLAEVREELETKLFRRDLNLFNQTLAVVVIDIASLYVYRSTEADRRKRGHSRDRRPDLPQFGLCVAVNASGWPIARKIFPGHTADRQALRQIVTALCQLPGLAPGDGPATTPGRAGNQGFLARTGRHRPPGLRCRRRTPNLAGDLPGAGLLTA